MVIKSKYEDESYIDARHKQHQDTQELYNRIYKQYDSLEDEWYGYLSKTIEQIVIKEFGPICRGKRVLDVGCGTGAQTILYQELGANVYGIDINRGMIETANYKSEQSDFDAVCFNGIAEQLPFKNESFDIVSCCGDVINYVTDIDLVVQECARVLRSPGYFILESGNRISYDIPWMLLDCIIGGRLKFRTSFREVWTNIIVRSGRLQQRYPLVTQNGIEMISLHFPTMWELTRLMEDNGFSILRKYGMNTVMNLLPFTLLSDPNAPIWIKRIGHILSKIDSRLISIPIIQSFACDLVMVCKRTL
jgi:ubiquinone/menaquinone biosynthesis C-methylase UbiE